MMCSLVLRGFKSLCVFVCIFLCLLLIPAFQTWALPKDLIPLSVNSRVVETDGPFTATVSTGIPFAATGILIGSKPGHDGVPANGIMLAIGSADAQGDYRYSTTVPAGYEGDDFYIMGIARSSNGSGLLFTKVQGVRIIPNKSTARYIVTPPNQILDTRNNVTFTNSDPIDYLLNKQEDKKYLTDPGDMILLEDGLHERFLVDRECDDDEAPRYVVARNIGAAEIKEHDSGGSPTINIKKGGCVTLIGMKVRPSAESIVRCSMGVVLKNISLLEMELDGGYNWVTGEGEYEYSTNVIWGVQAHGLKNFVFRGGEVKRLKKEHSFYFHNSAGDITVEDAKLFHLGRTATQFTAREGEGLGIQADGHHRIANLEIIDANLGDNLCSNGGGGSALSFNGRSPGGFHVQNVIYRAGFDSELNNAMGCVTGTGALVSHFGDYSAGVSNGALTLQDVDFQCATDGCNRDLIKIEASTSFKLVNSILQYGGNDHSLKVEIEPMPLGYGGITLDPNAVVSNDIELGDRDFTTYQQALSFISNQQLQ